MRIIGGKYRGKTINPPQGYAARPTTDFAKEGLFNILDNEYEFEGLSVLDLFGGTGSISCEFASRGAADVICVEMNPSNAAFIKSQVKKLDMKAVSVVRHNVFDFLKICSRSFDIVFADPPYAIDGLETIPDRVLASRAVKPGGYFILEHPGTVSFHDRPFFVKERKYGNVHFTFFEAPQQEEQSPVPGNDPDRMQEM